MSEEFADIYREHYRAVLTVAQQRLRGVADPEDAVAETFRVAWSSWKNGEDITLPWLYRVLRNVIGNEYRRLERSGRLGERMSGLAGDDVLDASPDDALDVRLAMERLADADRELLRMRFWEDLEVAEIADVLGMTENGVRVRLGRVKRKLREVLRQMDGSSADGSNTEEVRDGRA